MFSHTVSSSSFDDLGHPTCSSRIVRIEVMARSILHYELFFGSYFAEEFLSHDKWTDGIVGAVHDSQRDSVDI